MIGEIIRADGSRAFAVHFTHSTQRQAEAHLRLIAFESDTVDEYTLLFRPLTEGEEQDMHDR